MANSILDWQLPPQIEIPPEFIAAIRKCKPTVNGKYAAKLLWQRGLREIDRLPGYLDCDKYQPSSPFAFGMEMTAAVERLKKAYIYAEKVAIWGDFDADGVTATSVLWDGLGQFFARGERLSYYIPDRMKESHGLNVAGIKKLAAQGITLIITCDTGSTNIKEVEYATKLGVDVIVTDHHTLPAKRPPVTAIINPRYFESEHPLFHLSGVAVAYKLVEALYVALPDIPKQPVEYLLDLVAIGLIADLVQLSGDCRYLAQQGIKRLTQQNQPDIDGFRPGVHKLLQLCKRNGDRPTDISFGIAPRINAISRIHGDASFGVELLTSKDVDRCHELAAETELANTRRKELQKNTTLKVQSKLSDLDLSTTSVIVLVDSNWSPGVLGLVAGQVAQEHGKPTILLSTNSDGDAGKEKVKVARGSARSTQNIDLYQLVNSQSHLLNSFGGHPFAAGMSIDLDNIPLFTEAINQQLQAKLGTIPPPSIATDLLVTLADLQVSNGRELFEDLLLLEPYGMGNPVPKLLIKNCQFKDIKNRNIQDFKGKTVQYIRTKFELFDATSSKGFPGIWWGHYEHEIPRVNCDAIVELDFNSYEKRFEIRLVEVRPAAIDNKSLNFSDRQFNLKVLDFRQESVDSAAIDSEPIIWVKQCPSDWDELQCYCQQAIQTSSKLALNYQSTNLATNSEILQQLLGIAKYAIQTCESINLYRLRSRLNISDRAMRLGLDALVEIGFDVSLNNQTNLVTITLSQLQERNELDLYSLITVREFFAAIEEEQFKRNYFLHVPVYAIEASLSH
ncbi:single-stranded-DNA-specific exonuclease RecJ [Chamaesiphon minutus]|uniref:Single-stranded-DNA-specific exonuclease RecJ n=1 Tax=Chamaesiphon minutus (strain ATCC 27169 / PCC 6605) TaxID=1173020 RepID=K9UA51_CHAP6|nr:single-stranded-DNA-specific exonuclease RecJ [Chamaesiphon minutus]AFY91498.1 single-stranded-DNA-specific exonuclease RecJ [Chamaesiphon minutus PCC 6605]